MPRTGVAHLPLHGGKAPRWLFTRMVSLAQGIVEIIAFEYSTDEFLQRISDPFWFQALACVLGFDWHSSGCTTVTCGALKEALESSDCGIRITGGKGKASRQTIDEIQQVGETFNLSSQTVVDMQYASRMSAKIDSSAIQDGYDLYHHVFIVTEQRSWAVIQQGLNAENRYARRYHWNSSNLSSFVHKPHQAILGETQTGGALDMTAQQSVPVQERSVDLVNDHPRHLRRDWALLTREKNQLSLDAWSTVSSPQYDVPCLNMPKTIDWDLMKRIYDFQPQNYEEILALKGVGSNTVRALALISELIYGEPPSWVDPVKYSFTVGGKDGVPYPVDRKAMDESICVLKQGILQAKLGEQERLAALQRLQHIVPRN